MKKNDKQTVISSKLERTRRQLDFEKRKKSGSLLKKKFYLDIKDGRQMRHLEAKLKQLGATIEKFLSKEVNYIITSNPLLSKHKSDKQTGAGDNTNTQNTSTPSPFNLGQSPSPNATAELRRIENVPRGKTLAKIAGGQQSPNTVLENAQKMGIKVVSYEQTVRYVEKEMAKHKPETSKLVPKKKSACYRNKVQTLKSPFIKFESENCQYRPVVQELELWPHINVETPQGTCPFDGQPLGHAHRSERAEHEMNAERIHSPDIPDTPKCQELHSPDTPHDEGKRMCCRGNDDSTCKLLGFPILTAGEIKQEREKKRRAARKQGYCEACKEKYQNIDKHLVGELHKQFVRNKANFVKLDKLIESGPSTATFISSVILRHCVLKAKEKPKCSNDVEHSVKLADDQMHTPKKNAVPTNLNRDSLITEESSPNDRKTVTEQPLQMIEMSQICPKHKKDRALCDCTVKLDSLSRQLAQSCSPGNSARQYRGTTNLKNVQLRSAALVKNSSARRLYGSPVRSGLRKVYVHRNSRQEMVIGNSQIASLQNVESVFNSYSQNQMIPCLDSSEIEDCSGGDLPGMMYTPSSNADIKCASSVPDEEHVVLEGKDCHLKKVQELSDEISNIVSECAVKTCCMENENSIIINANMLSNDRSNCKSPTSHQVIVSDKVKSIQSEVSLDEKKSVVSFSRFNKRENKMTRDQIGNSNTLNSDVSQSVSQLENVKDCVQPVKRTPECSEVVIWSESSQQLTEISVDINKTNDATTVTENNDLPKLSLQKNDDSYKNIIFCESAAERVKNRRAKSSNNNVDKGSRYDVSENNMYSSISKHRKRKSTTGESAGSFQTHRSRQSSGKSVSKIFPSGDAESTCSRTDNPENVTHFDDEHSVNESTAHSSFDRTRRTPKVPDFESETKEVSVCSLSPKYKKNPHKHKKDSCENHDSKISLDFNDYSLSSSPVFKRSPRYSKKTDIPVSAGTVREKESEETLFITKHSGFLRNDKSGRDKALENHQQMYLKETDIVNVADVSPQGATVKKGEEEDWDSPKSGFSKTPQGKSLLRRNQNNQDDVLKHSKKARLKVKKTKLTFTSEDKTQVPLDKTTEEADTVTSHNSFECNRKGKYTESAHVALHDPSEYNKEVKTSIVQLDEEVNNISSETDIKRGLKDNADLATNSKIYMDDDKQFSRKGQKRKLNEENTNSFSATKKFKLSHRWRILSERSVGKLLESESDAPSFHGYNKQLEAKLPSDLTYDELSEIEISDNSDKEWIIDEFSTRNKNDAGCVNMEADLEAAAFNEYLALQTSPRKVTDSSWDDACDSFLKTKYENVSTSCSGSKQSLFAEGKHKSVKRVKHQQREHKRSHKKKDRSTNENVLEIPDEINHDPTPLHRQKKSHKQKDKSINKNVFKMPNGTYNDPATPCKKKRSHSQKHKSLNENVLEMIDEVLENPVTPSKQKRSHKKTHKSLNENVLEMLDVKLDEPATPHKWKKSHKSTEIVDYGIQQIDKDISFNFCSPQKNKHELSPLRSVGAYSLSMNEASPTRSKLYDDNEHSTPSRLKNKSSKRKRHSQDACLKIKKSINVDFEEGKRTPKKAKWKNSSLS